MKIFRSYLLVIFLFALLSCNESTVNPINELPKETQIEMLCKSVWEIKESQNSIYYYKRLKFESNGIVWEQNNTDNDKDWTPWIESDWYYDSLNNLIVMDTPDPMLTVEPTKFKLHNLTNNELSISSIYSDSLQLIKYTPFSNNVLEFQISGKITFDSTITNPNEQDLSNARVAILWQNPAVTQTGIICGIGSIDTKSNSYTINTSYNIPVPLLSNLLSYPKIGFYNQGYIVLIFDNNLVNGQIFKMTDFIGIKFGTVEDRAINFIIGDYTSWDMGNLLQGNFDQGYNYCKGWYSSTTISKDAWQSTRSYKNQDIKVVKSNLGFKAFKFPNFD